MQELGRYKEAVNALAQAVRVWEADRKAPSAAPKPPQQPKFSHGTVVRATYLTNNVNSHKYIGTVVEVHANSTMSISYHDGDFWGECPFNCAILDVPQATLSQAQKSSPPPLETFLKEFHVGNTVSDVQRIPDDEIHKGKIVMAGWKHGSQLYAGTIKSVNKKMRTGKGKTTLTTRRRDN